MTWTEALAIVIDRTHHVRYAVLCADDHPDHATWRARMIAQATGEPIAEDPDVVIARVEAMAKQAPRGGGCCGG